MQVFDANGYAAEETRGNFKVVEAIDRRSRSTPSLSPNYAASGPFSMLDCLYRIVLRRRLKQMEGAPIELVDSPEQAFGRSAIPSTIHVHDPRFFRRVVFGGNLGAAESYIRGEWSAANLVELMRMLARGDRFIRMWHDYLCYCEAGFRERRTGVSQLLLNKPGRGSDQRRYQS